MESRTGLGEIGLSEAIAPEIVTRLSSFRLRISLSEVLSASIWPWSAGRSGEPAGSAASCCWSWLRWVWIGRRSANFSSVCCGLDQWR